MNMKQLFLLIYFLIINSSFSQENIIPQQAIDNLQRIEFQKNDNNLPQIYITDFETLDTIIKSSDKKYKIIYSFSNTCHFSFIPFPELLNYIL
jgi:hypothetical protein